LHYDFLFFKNRFFNLPEDMFHVTVPGIWNTKVCRCMHGCRIRVLKDGAKLSDVLYRDSNLLLAEAYSEELAPRGIMLEFTQSSIIFK